MCIRYNHERGVVEEFCRELRIWYAICPIMETPDRPDPEDAFPGDMAYIVTTDTERGLKLEPARFGIRSLASEPGKRPKWLHNARSETVAELRSFRTHFLAHRCIVPAPAFFEQASGRWLKMAPVHGAAFAVAGIYEPAKDGEPPGFAMVTTEPNLKIADVHDRMPVVLSPDDVETWLNQKTPADELQAMLFPCPEEWLEITDAGPNTRPKKVVVKDESQAELF